MSNARSWQSPNEGGADVAGARLLLPPRPNGKRPDLLGLTPRESAILVADLFISPGHPISCREAPEHAFWVIQIHALRGVRPNAANRGGPACNEEQT